MADQVLHTPTNPHFFQPLLDGFDSHLNIPSKFFSVHIEGRIEGNTMELKSNTCKKTWKVKMEGRRLTVGWKEFTIAHDLRIGDILIFRHEKDLVFHVTSFGTSCCELQYLPNNNKRNLSMDQARKTEHELSSDSSCFVAHIKDWNLQEDRLYLPMEFVRSNNLKKGSNKIIITNDGVKIWELNLLFKGASRKLYMSLGWRSFCNENRFQPGDSVTFKLEKNNTKTHILRFSIDESKCVSTKRKRKTGENRLLTLTVTSSSIKYCRLYLPKSFTRDNGMENAGGKKITLLDKCGKEWLVKLVISKGNSRMHLGLGLREYLNAIGIKTNESFVLELVWEDITLPPTLKFCSKIKT